MAHHLPAQTGILNVQSGAKKFLSFLIPSTDDDLRSCDFAAAPTGDSFAFDIDDALRTIPTPLPAATAALSRIEERVLENLGGENQKGV